MSNFKKICLVLVMVGLVLPLSWAGTVDNAAVGTRLPCRKIRASDYQQFIQNWNNKKYPVLYALIRTQAQYEDLFHPAAVMGKGRIYPRIDFNSEDVIVVSRVVNCPRQSSQMEKILQVSKIVIKDKKLFFNYRFNPVIDKHKTFLVKPYLAVRISKHSYNKVIFIENGKYIGELKPSKTMLYWSGRYSRGSRKSNK